MTFAEASWKREREKEAIKKIRKKIHLSSGKSMKGIRRKATSF
jgi:hypothetical protein